MLFTGPKPDFLLTPAERFQARIREQFADITEAELRYILTPVQFATAELIVVRGLSQNEASRRLGKTLHAVVQSIRQASKRAQQWRQWKSERGATAWR